MPHDLLGPCQVRQHVLAAKAVDARGLREEAALPTKDALPRIEEHLSPRVDHRQLVVRCFDNRVQVLNAKKGLITIGDSLTGINYETHRAERNARKVPSRPARLACL